MKKVFYIGFVFLLICTVNAVGQDHIDFQGFNIIGYWQTDSTLQLEAKKDSFSKSHSAMVKGLSDKLDRALKSREYIFHADGIFTAHWILGARPNRVRGRWEIVDKDIIVIEVNERKTEYLVNPNGNDRIVLVPKRGRIGEIHELYFIKQKE